MKIKQTFTRALLHPRYWTTWFGLGVLFLLVQLPYPLLMKLGSSAGRLSRVFLKRRVSIARRNLELCFPAISDDEKEAMIDNNFASLGMALVETGMAWFWSDRRVRQWFDVSGLEHLQHATAKGRGVMVIGIHFMSLELGGRAMGLCQPMMAMYRPHNNKAMEWVQTWGRSRSNKAMIDRKDLRGMVQALKRGEAVWFAPDQDYGPKGSVFAPFFAVKNAATTNGTYTISRLAKPAMMTTVLIRKPNALGYQLVIQPELQDYPYHDEQAAACYMNKVIEKEIMRAPEQYLWLHRRFKTRPAGEVSLYA
ncbi:kdo(2)-lipid IV(A) palmitoleoyltransferase [Pectobacterium carotovorum]|uniref:Lipid A biosynthesis acyltransferase n=1 Tax=Pectobacterium carotovorum subsp. carotovorum TaxID=555 RepID=A0AAI9PGN0_PECCC|nr:kdo(2)-lipid IV(A) palmitoleoyltransferase [Pectobacterium carotovorum]KHT32135.1 lipid A biosynthesis palmitoleoyl acyltransferase [Pectobacterium carotovorum subsp. carotovorum]MDK9421731.1 kdo(2)-lipid IV(A) palmitoleoyltransferase [Pectobacterium carotovorum]QHP55580.1 kdo(2)-lipid IV(A) palmitoleoyltransferase [Pectobacterium carotovorum subsp. carotovorum]QHP57133.1 kdo(2)-lipid IV(A) palmitoleoyltransferase [Pectobacterium carotovorum subsp. carotovorum]QLL94684.1 kdo(2)-lipid IV(A) 